MGFFKRKSTEQLRQETATLRARAEVDREMELSRLRDENERKKLKKEQFELKHGKKIAVIKKVGGGIKNFAEALSDEPKRTVRTKRTVRVVKRTKKGKRVRVVKRKRRARRTARRTVKSRPSNKRMSFAPNFSGLPL